MICILEAKFRLSDLLRVLPITTATFYYWKRQFNQITENEKIQDLILYIWNSDKNMGVRRITSELKTKFDLKVNHKRVHRLMQELNIQGQGFRGKARKYDSSKGPEGKRVKNHVKRRFTAKYPHQKMTSDVTEFRIPGDDKRIYLEPIMDLYNKEILTYSITDGSPNLEFALEPLNDLTDDLNNEPYKHYMHTDQGWQYRHHSWQRKLKKMRVSTSMSRRATCLDNAAMESFFNKLKVEIGDLKQYKNSEELITAIQKWITYYNTKRIQMKLGGVSPIEYRQNAA